MPSRTMKCPGDMPITYLDLDQPVALGHSLPAGRCPWSGLTAPRHVHPQPAHRSVCGRAVAAVTVDGPSLTRADVYATPAAPAASGGSPI
jgi:hypothetical protein